MKMDIEYMDIVTGEFFSSIQVVNKVLSQYVPPWSWERWGNVILAIWEKHFISVCENKSQYPRIVYPFIPANRYIISWMLHQIFMSSDKVL